MARFENLDVWKRASRLCADIYLKTAPLKDFGYRDQITRACLSVPSNIAEGYERGSEKEKANFLKYAKGSTGELRAQVFIGMKIGYLDKDLGNKWVAETREISKMLFSLIQMAKSKS